MKNTMERTLSHPQELALLRKHLLGDFGTHTWSTIKSLMTLGFIAEDGKYLVVTDKGKAYCMAHHVDMPNPFIPRNY